LSVTFIDTGFVCHSFAGDDFKDCRDHVKARLGLPDDRPAPVNDYPPNPVLLLNEQGRIDRAEAIWTATVSLPGTLAETYLASRGLAYDGEAIRFHPGTRAMVAMMTDIATDEPCGVHRTFLDGAGRKLGRKMLGRARGAVVRLSADDEVTGGLAIAEGIETALATGFQPIWACLSAGTMSNFPVLAGIEALTVFADNDVSGTGQAAAENCARRWHAADREVTVVLPTETGVDFATREAA
jgi:hypothetical protein